MQNEVITYCEKSDKVNIDLDLALRFLRVRQEPDDETKAMLNSCLEEFKNAVSYKSSYRFCDIKINDNEVTFNDSFTLKSEKLSKNLSGCDKAVIFTATTSVAVDRLIRKYMELQLSRAVIIDAIGSSAIEAFCDHLCTHLQDTYNVNFRPRFSPGYGDLSIKTQPLVLGCCDASRKIGVTLTHNNLMIPSKSVSAIAGIRPKDEVCEHHSRCENCEKENCLYRE